jgi:hypothetical protein
MWINIPTPVTKSSQMEESGSSSVREVRVFGDHETGKDKRNHNRAHANRIDRGLLQALPKEKHDRGTECREERDQINVI